MVFPYMVRHALIISSLHHTTLPHSSLLLESLLYFFIDGLLRQGLAVLHRPAFYFWAQAAFCLSLSENLNYRIVPPHIDSPPDHPRFTFMSIIVVIIIIISGLGSTSE
jgi:hypothetical protein